MYIIMSKTTIAYKKNMYIICIMNNYKLDLQLPVQSVPITTKVVSSNPVHGKVYSIQHYQHAHSRTAVHVSHTKTIMHIDRAHHT
jgi:hypothetical protein